MRIGIIGPGWISDFHYSGIQSSGVGNVTSITGGRKTTLERRASQWGVEIKENVDDLVKTGEIDAVWLCSPTAVHFEQLRLLLLNGIPVLVEKPPTATIEEALCLKDLVDRHNTLVMPGHNQVYRRTVMRARQSIQEGNLGRVIAGSLTEVGMPPEELMTGWRKTLKNPVGGALADSGYHLIYLALLLLGRPKSVYGFKSRQTWDIAAEDTAWAMLQYSNGVCIHLLQSWATNKTEPFPQIALWGTEGSLTIGESLSVNGDVLAKDSAANPFAEMAVVFSNSIAGHRKPVHELSDAIDTMAICKAFYRSCRSGKAELIEYPVF
ncbi:MAG: Gfo/Idh/MocA family protein [Bacilli bacterium]